MEEKKSFVEADSGGDFDSAPTKVSPNSWVNMENCRTLTTDAGEVGNVESIGSTILIENPNLPAGTNYRINSIEDQAKSRTVYFIWNSNGDHAIFVLFTNTDTILPMLLNAQVTGGLNFYKNSLIFSRIANGCVYWTDNLNQPRRADIDAGLKMNNPSYVTKTLPYLNPVSQSVIAWVRRQPGLPPIATKITQTSPVLEYNFIATEAFLFQYRYQYRNFEFSTLSADSLLCNFNATADTFNRIDITIPLGEQIDQDVIKIDVVASFLQSGVSFVIYSFITAQIPAAIANHNNGTQALKVIFYNDQIGTALDAAYAAKPFDSVPILAKTPEVAKNRNFLGNYVIGYDTPATSSLSAIPIKQSQPGGGVVGEWFLIDLVYVPNDDPTEQVFSAYIIKLTTIVPTAGYYAPFPLFPITPGGGPPFPASVDFSTMNYLGADPATTTAALAEAAASPDGLISYSMLDLIDQNTTVNITGTTGSVPGLVNQIIFKTDDYYELAINFRDFAGMECGAVANPPVRVQIPERTYNQTSYYAFIQWALSNVNALAEIPDWAYYYSINITKSLRTRFFIEVRGRNLTYATKDASNNYVFNTTTYALTNVGVAVDLTTIFPLGLGYQFAQGDIMKLYLPTGNFTMSVIDQAGQYVIGQLQDVGTIGNQASLYATFIVELYTPYQLQANEPYYEVSQLYKVANPTLPNRTYSIPSGQIEGDCYLLARTDIFGQYLAEAMNPNDKFFKLWFTDSGRPTFVDTIGQTKKEDTICFSNTFIQGSQSNGLSTFDALDTKDIFPECGPITALQLTSKVEGAQGNVMLVLCEEETVSGYLSESQLVAASENADVAISNGVIGTLNVLKGNFGCSHAESVKEFRGLVFFWNAVNGKFIQYSSNGLFPISNYKMTRFWKLFSQQFLSMTQAEIEALGSRPFVFTEVDPHHWEVLVSVPKLLAVPPKGYLPDYPDMIYPFDIWDGQAKTVVFKLSAEPNHWQGAFNIPAEGFSSIDNSVYAFKNADVWKMNDTETFGNLLGTQFKSRIMFVANQVPSRPKIYNSISVESNLKPTLTYFRTEPTLSEFDQYDLYEQASDLVDFDYNVKEGQLYSHIYQNKLIPTAEGFTTDGLLTGEKMRALVLKILLEFQTTNNPVELRAVDLGFQISTGHTT